MIQETRKKPERLWAKRLPLQLALVVVLTGCLSPLERFTEYAGGQVVISGQISTISENNAVYVGITSNSERLPEPVFDASVELLDNQGNLFDFFSDAIVGGKYVLPYFSAIPGHTYHIRVTLANGETYTSKPETMPTEVGEDEVFYAIEADDYVDGEGIVGRRDFLKIFTNTTLPEPSDPVFLKWHVEEIYMLSPTDFPDPFGNVPPPCFIDQHVDPQRIVLFNTEEIDAPLIPGMLLVQRLIDPTFKEKHYFTAYQSSMTREGYDYWRRLDIVANQSGSIFDEPPARIKGNITNTADATEEVYGYFQAVNQTFQRFYLLPHDLPYGMPIYCEYREDREYFDYPAECLNCTTVRNSSYNRPPWF